MEEMNGREAALWVLVVMLVLSNVGLWLSTADHYRFNEYRMEEINALQDAVGQMTSCIKFGEWTDNYWCPKEHIRHDPLPPEPKHSQEFEDEHHPHSYR